MLAKIAEDTQINKTMDFIPDKKTHGIWLAATNIVKPLRTSKKQIFLSNYLFRR